MPGAEPNSLLPLCSSLAGPQGRAYSWRSAWPPEPGLQRLSVQWLALFFPPFVFNRKMFPAPPTLSWAGLGNHFQMGNNFRGEEQLKLQAILRQLPGRGRPARVREGSQGGQAVETGCGVWLSCGQATWAPANRVGCYLGAVARARHSSHVPIPRHSP